VFAGEEALLWLGGCLLVLDGSIAAVWGGLWWYTA